MPIRNPLQNNAGQAGGIPATHDGAGTMDPAGAAAVRGAAKAALQPSQLVVIGDSWAARGYSSSATATSWTDLGIFRWAIALSGQRIEQILPTAGVGGTEYQTWNDTLLQPVLDQLTRPTRIAVILGINDISSDRILGDENTQGTVIYHAKRVFDRIRAAGHTLCINTVPPHGPSYVTQGASQAAKNIQRRILNKWITEYAAANAGCEFVDLYSQLIDPSSAGGYMFASYEDALTGGANNPGIHCAAAGARAGGAAWAARWLATENDPRVHVCTTTDSYDTDTTGTNRINNPLFLGTGGSTSVGAGTTITATQIATNWTVATQAGGAATVVCTTAARTKAADGDAIGQNQVLTITGATAVDMVSVRTGSLAGRFAVGDRLFGEVMVRITGAANLRGARLLCQHVLDGVTNTFTDQSFLASGFSYDQGDAILTLKTPIYTIGNAAALTGQIMTADFAFGGAGGAAVIRVGRAQWRKVN